MSPSLEATIRLGCFAFVLVSMALLEHVLPRRHRTLPRRNRWPGNLGLAAINLVVPRLVLPISAVATANWASANGWGAFNRTDWPHWIEFVFVIAILDLAIYFQHYLFHRIPFLWRIHRVHHADLDLDVTSGLRFHTLEILISAAFKLLLVIAIGPSPIAVITFEILLNAMAMFNHSNLKIPSMLDRLLRLCIVTPDMHRVHHSMIVEESNSNFGFNICWWDRLLGTYRAQPSHGHEEMAIGIMEFREPAEAEGMASMITMPFK